MDETGFEPVRLRLQRSALPLELFVRFESCERFELSSFDLQSNAYAMSATRTFAESSGFEPLHQLPDDGLANHYINRYVNSPLFCGEKEIRTLEAVTPSLFSRQHP